MADLLTKKMYVYYHCKGCDQPNDPYVIDFDTVKVIDLDDELEAGNHEDFLDDLTYVDKTQVMFPALTDLLPSNGATGVSTSANLVMTFEGNVHKNTGIKCQN